MSQRTGFWLIGARGGVATTAIVGLLALQKKLTATHGLVTELPQFQSLSLNDWGDFVIGGHDIRDTTLQQEAEKLLSGSRILTPQLLEACSEDFEKGESLIHEASKPATNRF